MIGIMRFFKKRLASILLNDFFVLDLGLNVR
jgi:hypothetical protein